MKSGVETNQTIIFYDELLRRDGASMLQDAALYFEIEGFHDKFKKKLTEVYMFVYHFSTNFQFIFDRQYLLANYI